MPKRRTTKQESKRIKVGTKVKIAHQCTGDRFPEFDCAWADVNGKVAHVISGFHPEHTRVRLAGSRDTLFVRTEDLEVL